MLTWSNIKLFNIFFKDWIRSLIKLEKSNIINLFRHSVVILCFRIFCIFALQELLQVEKTYSLWKIANQRCLLVRNVRNTLEKLNRTRAEQLKLEREQNTCFFFLLSLQLFGIIWEKEIKEYRLGLT